MELPGACEHAREVVVQRVIHLLPAVAARASRDESTVRRIRLDEKGQHDGGEAVAGERAGPVFDASEQLSKAELVHRGAARRR